MGFGISNANWSVTGFTGCVPASGGVLRDRGVCWINNPNLGHFGLAPLRGPRCLHMSASAATAPVMTGISFGIRSGPGSDPRGRRNSTPVYVISSSTRTTSVPTRLYSSSDCSPLIFWLLLFKLLVYNDHLRRLHYPGMKIPGHGHQIVVVTGVDNNTRFVFYNTFIATISSTGGRYYSQQGAYSHGKTHGNERTAPTNTRSDRHHWRQTGPALQI